MAEIVNVAEFASAIRQDINEATKHLLLLELAAGLVADEIGEQDPWPTVAKSVTLGAAARAYYNPEGVRQESVGSVSISRDSAAIGVYLTDGELERLRGWVAGNSAGKPVFEFPSTWPFPDRVERDPGVVTG